MVSVDDDAPLDARVVRTRKDVLAAAVDLLLNEGWDAVTQPAVARAAGYSKATVYSHWPERHDLLRDALRVFGDMKHSEPTGDTAADLLEELRSYRAAMAEHRLDRVMAALADRSMTDPDVVPLRAEFVADGERVLRSVLTAYLDADTAEAALSALSGAVIHRVFFHGVLPDDDELARVVRIVLEGVGTG